MTMMLVLLACSGDGDVDDDTDEVVLSSWSSRLPVTTSSTCHHLDCDTSSWWSVSITELQSKPVDDSSSSSNVANRYHNKLSHRINEFQRL